MKEFYCNIDPTRKNYLIISEYCGYAHIEHDAKTDDELGADADYQDFVAISTLEIGESCQMSDGCAIVLRIS